MSLCEHRKPYTSLPYHNRHRCVKRHFVCGAWDVLLCPEMRPGIIAIMVVVALLALLVMGATP